jgi:hypothetical protein
MSGKTGVLPVIIPIKYVISEPPYFPTELFANDLNIKQTDYKYKAKFEEQFVSSPASDKDNHTIIMTY